MLYYIVIYRRTLAYVSNILFKNYIFQVICVSDRTPLFFIRELH